MTINASDVKLQQPQRLTDNDDGGGQMTGNEIVDGTLNNLFPNIARLDRTTGRVSLRKGFLHVDAENTDVLLGAHMILTQPPADPNVALVLFDTGAGDGTDERSDAANYVEKYLVSGPTTGLLLYDRQVSGQKQILCYADPTVIPPQPGDTLALSVEGSGLTAHVQYMRATKVAVQLQSFLVPIGNNGMSTVNRNVVTLDISVALDQDYPGEDPQTLTTEGQAKVKVRTTRAADAAEYYGIVKLSTAAAAGDTTLQLASVYGQLVPSTTQENPLTNQPPVQSVQAIVASGAAETAVAQFNASNIIVPNHMGSSIVPGSVTVTDSKTTATDVNGVLKGGSGTLLGTVDYQNGVVAGKNSNDFIVGGIDTKITFTPGAPTQQPPYSTQQAIDESTRRQNYVFALSPVPAPLTVTVSYRALGVWYVLTDDGAGALVPKISGTGAGTIKYSTGALSLTCGALPDVGSAVLVSWGQTAGYAIQAGVIASPTAAIHYATADGKTIEPNTLTITWNDGTTARTASDNGSGGLTGDASGTVLYYRGTVDFVPTSLASSDTGYTIAYSDAPLTEPVLTGTVSGDTMTGTLGANIQPNTVRLAPSWDPRPIDSSTGFAVAPQKWTTSVVDDGQGKLLDGVSNDVIGTVDYTTGAFSFTDTLTRRTGVYTYGKIADVSWSA